VPRGRQRRSGGGSGSLAASGRLRGRGRADTSLADEGALRGGGGGGGGGRPPPRRAGGPIRSAAQCGGQGGLLVQCAGWPHHHLQAVVPIVKYSDGEHAGSHDGADSDADSEADSEAGSEADSEEYSDDPFWLEYQDYVSRYGAAAGVDSNHTEQMMLDDLPAFPVRRFRFH